MRERAGQAKEAVKDLSEMSLKEIVQLFQKPLEEARVGNIKVVLNKKLLELPLETDDIKEFLALCKKIPKEFISPQNQKNIDDLYEARRKFIASPLKPLNQRLFCAHWTKMAFPEKVGDINKILERRAIDIINSIDANNLLSDPKKFLDLKLCVWVLQDTKLSQLFSEKVAEWSKSLNEKLAVAALNEILRDPKMTFVEKAQQADGVVACFYYLKGKIPREMDRMYGEIAARAKQHIVHELNVHDLQTLAKLDVDIMQSSALSEKKIGIGQDDSTKQYTATLNRRADHVVNSILEGCDETASLLTANRWIETAAALYVSGNVAGAQNIMGAVGNAAFSRIFGTTNPQDGDYFKDVKDTHDPLRKDLNTIITTESGSKNMRSSEAIFSQSLDASIRLVPTLTYHLTDMTNAKENSDRGSQSRLMRPLVLEPFFGKIREMQHSAAHSFEAQQQEVNIAAEFGRFAQSSPSVKNGDLYRVWVNEEAKERKEGLVVNSLESEAKRLNKVVSSLLQEVMRHSPLVVVVEKAGKKLSREEEAAMLSIYLQANEYSSRGFDKFLKSPEFIHVLQLLNKHRAQPPKDCLSFVASENEERQQAVEKAREYLVAKEPAMIHRMEIARSRQASISDTQTSESESDLAERRRPSLSRSSSKPLRTASGAGWQAPTRNESLGAGMMRAKMQRDRTSSIVSSQESSAPSSPALGRQRLASVSKIEGELPQAPKELERKPSSSLPPRKPLPTPPKVDEEKVASKGDLPKVRK